MKGEGSGGVGCCGWLDPKAYEKYFNITETDVKKRLKLALTTPHKNSFHEEIEDNPDLWGPIWIYTTMLVALLFGRHLCLAWQHHFREDS